MLTRRMTRLMNVVAGLLTMGNIVLLLMQWTALEKANQAAEAAADQAADRENAEAAAAHTESLTAAHAVNVETGPGGDGVWMTVAKIRVQRENMEAFVTSLHAKDAALAEQDTALRQKDAELAKAVAGAAALSAGRAPPAEASTAVHFVLDNAKMCVDAAATARCCCICCCAGMRVGVAAVAAAAAASAIAATFAGAFVAASPCPR